MQEYKVKGLSCANCAREMEEAIQQLEKGENAKLFFNSSKLLVDPSINMEKVENILASDGAAIEYDENVPQTKGKKSTFSLDEGTMWKVILTISTLLFFTAILFESGWNDFTVVSVYLIATAISGYKTFMKGLRNLLSFKFNIDTLMTIALVGAFSIGEWKEGTLVAILFGVNEYLEGLGMEKARRSMDELLKIAPKQATVIENGKPFVTTVSSLTAGQTVLVRSGEQIPSDGIIKEGASSVNEAAITGESLPVEKGVGDSVYGGSINNEGLLKIEITKAYEDSSLAKILHLVEEAQETKTPTELFINRFAKYYTPLIMIISALVMILPPILFQGDWGTWFYQGLAVLIIGCPCSLILASPIAIISGITRNARHGILVKGGVYLEQLGKIDAIAFDKTGTLTKGKPYVEQFVSYDDRFLFVAGSLEKSSTHPIAKAIVEKVEELGIQTFSPDELTTLSGQGIKGVLNGKEYWVGNEKSLLDVTISKSVQADIDDLKRKGYTIVIVADRSEIFGIFGIADQVREESTDVIHQLHHVGVKQTIMLTGDHNKTAEKVAKQVGVTDYYGNLMPDEKLERIQQLKKQMRVAMVGDGINDAPALAAADLGIAMGKGTDSAIETADIVLMQDHLGKLPDAIRLSKRVNKTIAFNITLALSLKLLALLLAIPGWLTLWIAILSDMGATIIVTLISLLILVEKKK
ncbi:heavy metal translocating P-type ATPase [Fervidibacillus albus]|uniref:Cd(2+)-exporting ATPase n=1 Tax=Fervidibacillus albus TaxID=2980026 RepID=A0A9E8LUH7_9BACI|nr:heavy metal translocating P-type ATPase [Fervidibacillus albus]WAA09039.1 heavy metal translocating P-type ATPase [Fervidibacillus albus]